jgi:DNA-binding beta-propeller fold protein YncE
MYALAISLLLLTCGAAAAHFEARHTHPLELTPDGSKLLAVNSTGGFLSVLDPGTPGSPAPRLLAEIPVGLEPVTVRARTNREAWVVNELSDSISIVDLERGTVTLTLPVPDEPADLVFADGKAFVCCGRAGRIAVFDTASRVEIASIPLRGNFPRALSLSPDGTRLSVAFLLSGNNTTALHFRQAPPPPAPENPVLPPAPRTALIVPDSDPRIPYDVLDHDVAEIDTATHQVLRYHGGLGTNLFALAHGTDGTLWAAASEARNLIRFEPALNGIFAESRVARVLPGGGSVVHDLNPQASAAVVAEEVRQLALAQPMALLPRDSGMWVAAFGSDRVAEMDATGEVLRRIDLRTGTTADGVRGPRGLVRSSSLGRLYVLNKLSATITVIDEMPGVVVAEVPLASHEALPADQRLGRGFFFDARRSGNGTVACGACHFDADHDGVAWDLGDPGGEMVDVTVRRIAIGEPEPVIVPLHPMKGPMVTQSLRGIRGGGPFHWRGDKADIRDFNSSFARLQAGDELPAEDMDRVAVYLESLSNHPNPNRNRDDTLKSAVAGGDPVKGRAQFFRHSVCSKCHPEPRGTDHNIDDHEIVLTTQPVKNITLEHVYRKTGFTPDQPVTASGFGFTHDGTGHDLPRGHEYDLDNFSRTPGAEADVMAYVLSASTGTAPAVGWSWTLRAGDPDPTAIRGVLESQAGAGKCDAVLRGMLGGRPSSFLFLPQIGRWQPADRRQPLEFAAVLGALVAGDSLTLLGVPPGAGPRFSIDRNGNGIPNDAEAPPRLEIATAPLRLLWPADAAGWQPEHSADLEQWLPCPPAVMDGARWTLLPPPAGPYFRLRRAW